MDLKQAQEFAERILRLHTCEGSDPAREAEELLAFSLGVGRADLLREPERKLNGSEEARLAEIVARRIDHEPMARIFGKASFLGRDFAVDRNVLVPRPATEIIVGRAIEACSAMDEPTVIDVGTGSGCAAISFALGLPRASVIATDISPEALEVARRNALTHRVADRIDFLLSDLLSDSQALKLSDSPLIIFANLPYIPTDSVYYLSPCVTAGEPMLALDGGPDGLVLYRRLLDQLAESAGDKEMMMFFELLPGQITKMKDEIKKRFPDAEISEIRPGGENEAIGLEIRK